MVNLNKETVVEMAENKCNEFEKFMRKEIKLFDDQVKKGD